MPRSRASASDGGSGGDVPRRDPVRLEDDDVVVRLPSRDVAGDDLGQLVHLEPVENSLRDGLDEVAGLEPCVLAGVAAHEGGALQHRVVELPAARDVRAGGAHERAGAQPLAAQHRVLRRRDRDDDVLRGGFLVALCGVRSDRVGECLTATGVAAVDDRRRDVRERRADRGDLRLGLVTAADHAEAHGAFLREVLRCHAARRAGAQPAELIGLDHRQHVVPRSIEQHEHELHAARAGGVRLHAGDAEAEVGGRHHGQPAVLEPQPVARAVLDLARRLPPKRSLDRLERVADREDRLDVLLGQVQRHGRKPIAGALRRRGGALRPLPAG